MGLNIKKEQVHALAREAAARTGMSQTSVIEAALEQYLGRLSGPADDAERRRRVAEVLEDVDDRMTPDLRAALTTDDLYDDSGLPA